ncbi:MAG: CPBP family intramembrane metalloprotease [bacterium]|nr:CPBP family intramembrane metalloprotease [bacterium]
MRTPAPAPTAAPAPGIWTTWSSWRILGLAVALLAADYAVQLLVHAMEGGLTVPALAGALLGVVAPLVLLALDGTLRPRTDLGLHAPAARTSLLVLGFAAAGTMPTSLLAGWSSHLHPVDPEWVRLVNESLPDSTGALVVTVLAVVVVAPLAEEIIFRALLQRLCARLWGGLPAAVITAIVFGLVHGEPWYVFGLVGVGLVLALVWEATGSLLACWLAHAVHNGIVLTLQLTTPADTGEARPLDLDGGLLVGGSLVVLVVLGRTLLAGGRRRADGG